MKRKDLLLRLALKDNIVINNGRQADQESSSISNFQFNNDPDLSPRAGSNQMENSPHNMLEMLDQSCLRFPQEPGKDKLVNAIPQLEVCIDDSPLPVAQIEGRELDSPLTVEQLNIAAEMETMDLYEDENVPDSYDAMVKDLPLFSHSANLSVFSITDDIEQQEPENETFESEQQLTPLFTPLPSVQPLTPNHTVTSSSTLNESLLQHDLDSDNDDSVADPNYLPSENSDFENMPSPNTPLTVNEPHSISSELPFQSAPPSVDSTASHQDDITDLTITRRNKRKVPEHWKQNLRKANRNKGVEYTSIKGKLMPAKKCKSITEPCKCQRVCSANIDNDTKQQLFDAFWGLGRIERQRDFLAKNITCTKAVTSRVSNSRRKQTLSYHFVLNGKNVNVCKIFFLNTLDISEKMVRTALKKASNGVGEVLSPDKRGRHRPANKYDDDQIEFATDHIDLFPAVPSHWCRKDTKKIYLESTLNKEKLYDLYKEHCLTHGKKPICKTSYKELVLSKNIDFHKPKKDQCWCHKYEQLIDDELILKQNEFEEHVCRKDYAKEEKRLDKVKASENSSVHVCTFDFEAVLYCPLVLGKPVFYKRKLGNMNFTIHNAVTKQGYCYFWPEYEGNRGANEVSTCLFDYISKLSNVEHLILYSDCCPGQNRNSVVMAMLHFVMTLPENNIKVIDYKFLEPGHTHMECDNMHSTIERASEYAKIYIPEDWQNVIRLARKDNPYAVKVLNHTDFFDFKAVRNVCIPNTIKSTDGTVLKWGNVRWLQFRKDAPDALFFKCDYWEGFKVSHLKRITRRSETILQKLYTTPVPLKAVKHKDLMAMCKDGTIPTCYHNYYEKLPVLGSNTSTRADEDDEMALNTTRASYLKRRPRTKN